MGLGIYSDKVRVIGEKCLAPLQSCCAESICALALNKSTLKSIRASGCDEQVFEPAGCHQLLLLIAFSHFYSVELFITSYPSTHDFFLILAFLNISVDL